MIGAILGGLTSLIPNVVNGYIQSKQDQADKKHELELARLQIEAQQKVESTKLEAILAQNESILKQSENNFESERMKTISSIESMPLSSKTAEVLRALVRPGFGYVSMFIFAMSAFNLFYNGSIILSSNQIYEVLQFVVSYYFADRTNAKIKK